jgi:hemolysin III
MRPAVDDGLQRAKAIVEAARPRFRGVLHQWAFVLSIPAGLALVAMARGGTARIGAAVYALSLTGLYGTSAAYHRLARSERARLWLRRLDHSMIYVLIAGTATPLGLLVLDGPWRVAGLALMWAGAVAGVVLKMTPLAWCRFGSALYIILGWMGLLALPKLLTTLSPANLVLLVTGGVLYTVGAVVLLRRRPDPAPSVFGYHEVWHAFTVAAGACHFAFVWLLATAG